MFYFTPVLSTPCINRYVKKDIRDYVTNDQRCRKKIIHEVYDSKHSLYTCCEFCHQRCDCGNCESPDFLVDFLSSRDEIQLLDNETDSETVKIVDICIFSTQKLTSI